MTVAKNKLTTCTKSKSCAFMNESSKSIVVVSAVLATNIKRQLVVRCRKSSVCSSEVANRTCPTGKPANTINVYKQEVDDKGNVFVRNTTTTTTQYATATAVWYAIRIFAYLLSRRRRAVDVYLAHPTINVFYQDATVARDPFVIFPSVLYEF